MNKKNMHSIIIKNSGKSIEGDCTHETEKTEVPAEK